MKADMEMVLVHDGAHWIARNGTFEARGNSLPELDDRLAAKLRETGDFDGSRITVFMCFDYATIPTWIRQYASHYFNRYVSFDL